MLKIPKLFNRKKEIDETESSEEEFKLQGLTEQEADIIAPPSIIERMPGENNATDYWVEFGDNTGGASYLRTWFLKFTGRTTFVGMFDPIMLSEGDGAVDITVSIEPAEISHEINVISNRIAVLRAELTQEHNPGKVGAMMQELSDLEEQLGRLRVNAEKLFNTSVALNVSSNTPDKLRRLSRTIIKRLSGMGIRFNAADTRQLEAWRHTVGIGPKVIAKPHIKEMESSNVADFFLFGYGGLSHRKGVLLGFDHFRRPVFYDGWDRRLNNSNMVVFGRAGSGKSFAIKVLTRRSAALGISTGIIDPEREYKNLVLAMNGPYAELSPKHADYQRLNYYDVREEEDERGRVFVDIEEAYQGVQAVIFKMIRTVDESALTGAVKVAVHDTTIKLYKQFNINSSPESLYELVNNEYVIKEMPTLYDHYQLMLQDERLSGVTPLIKLFTREGGDDSKAIFDGQSTFKIGEGRVFGISTADLDEEWMKPIGSFIANKWTWERFGKKDRFRKKRIISDEAQLQMEDPEQAKWLENAYRRGRKLNVSMCAVTQGFEVFLRVPEGMGILKNAPTKLLLRQESIDIDAVQGKFNLAEGEARFLLTASAGVGILRVNEESTIVSIQPTANEYWLYTTNPNDYEQGIGA
ncbi:MULTISPECIES: VirB4 family type IV secretion system protein [Paenibacillus]|uniref:DUF87 domain-containing protein n=2 Tax=Paenibacillus TaxID=44249 RepID=A0A7Y6EUH4_9BACL|nr:MULTISPECIES: DUF87 domain-containing protein [Paenibacillus]KGP78383.1 hypothetical protein P363_0132205 [Paenibacillus sp. MAEPY1]KGP78442.1 hypothetical protein P364_0128830 [Paenibacillus sp. MAEPY2]MDN4603998.1 DUF87 domain-containing protein [Paenibacillus vandeheii]NUU74694.1 DUF87 domain-containing protein [Paenibacillus xylanilyticus]